MMPLDVASWKLEVLELEQFAPPTVRLRDQRSVSNSGLADCVRNHRYLKPVELDAGESGMALLLLWEVDHGLAFPGTRTYPWCPVEPVAVRASTG